MLPTVGLVVGCALEEDGEGPGHRPQQLALTPDQELELGREAYRRVLSEARGRILSADTTEVRRCRGIAAPWAEKRHLTKDGLRRSQAVEAGRPGSAPANFILKENIMSFGTGDFYRGGNYGPGGPYGAWPGCGCGSLFIILAGFLLVFGGCLRMLGQ
jgi:hypothetical protein